MLEEASCLYARASARGHTNFVLRTYVDPAVACKQAGKTRDARGKDGLGGGGRGGARGERAAALNWADVDEGEAGVRRCESKGETDVCETVETVTESCHGPLPGHDASHSSHCEGPELNEHHSSVWESEDEYTEVSEGGTPLRLCAGDEVGKVESIREGCGGSRERRSKGDYTIL